MFYYIINYLDYLIDSLFTFLIKQNVISQVIWKHIYIYSQDYSMPGICLKNQSQSDPKLSFHSYIFFIILILIK